MHPVIWVPHPPLLEGAGLDSAPPHLFHPRDFFPVAPQPFLLDSPHVKTKILHPTSRTPPPPLRTPPRNRHAPGSFLRRRRTVQPTLCRRTHRLHSKRRPANCLHPPGLRLLGYGLRLRPPRRSHRSTRLRHLPGNVFSVGQNPALPENLP